MLLEEAGIINYTFDEQSNSLVVHLSFNFKSLEDVNKLASRISVVENVIIKGLIGGGYYSIYEEVSYTLSTKEIKPKPYTSLNNTPARSEENCKT